VIDLCPFGTVADWPPRRSIKSIAALHDAVPASTPSGGGTSPALLTHVKTHRSDLCGTTGVSVTRFAWLPVSPGATKGAWATRYWPLLSRQGHRRGLPTRQYLRPRRRGDARRGRVCRHDRYPRRHPSTRLPQGGPRFAIGAARARPDAPIVLITGDGAAGFHLQEFDTRSRHRIRVVTVVFNNEVWGVSVHGQHAVYKCG